MRDVTTAAEGPRALLRLEPCARAVSAEAVRRWHYTGSVQTVTVDQFAVYEDGALIGAIVYSSGPQFLSRRYGCKPAEACELARVALDAHVTPVSRIVAVSLRLLRARKPRLRVVVSYADTSVGHHGGIYQAGGWVYTGGTPTHAYRINGLPVHPRTLGSLYGTGGQSLTWLRANVDSQAERIDAGFKHRYLMPFHPSVREIIAPMAQPYPRRVK